MGYLISSGTGYLKDAVQTVSNIKSYLINKTGYIVDNIRIGYQDFGTRVFDDGGIIESYSCASDSILDFPLLDSARGLFDLYSQRVVANGGSAEAESCTVNKLSDLL
jgi:hypothetical protein